MTNLELYQEWLMILLTLCNNGFGDSPEAEALRDRMDEPWSKLTEAEKNQLHRGIR